MRSRSTSAGYNAFVLKYRAGRGGTIATQDLAAALAFIFRNAAALGVTTADYSLWGSSAGARMAAGIGSYGTARFGGSELPKPAALVLLYTGHSDVASTEPPTFVAVGDADGIAPPAIMERRVAALRRLGTEVEYRKYRGVGHGFGLGTGTTAEGWIGDALLSGPSTFSEGGRSDAAAMIATPRMTVLVVGATGSIGHLVVKEAARKRHAARALVRDSRKARGLILDAEMVVGD